MGISLLILTERRLERLEEVQNVLLVHFLALVLHCEQRPDFTELLQIIFEGVHWIFRVRVIFIELVQKHQDEEIDHDFGRDHVKGDEIEPCPVYFKKKKWKKGNIYCGIP